MSSEAFEQLLKTKPELRRRRYLGADLLRKLLCRVKGQCTWCGGQLPRGRQRWCSNECIDQYRLRCDAGFQARFVSKRDGGVCALCAQKAYCEVDHVTPVCQGGGLCSPDELRLLCQGCHKIETNKLRASKKERQDDA